MTEIEAGKLVTALVTAFPDGLRFLDEEQQRATMKMYRYMLRDLEAAHAGHAIARVIATCKKWPSIAEIREAYDVQTNGRNALGLEAWGRVQKAMAREGRNRKPGIDFQFKDPIALRVVDAMGWRYLCDSPDHVPDRARFIELYDQLAKRDAIDQAVGIEIAPPIPRRELHGGPRSFAAIVGDVLPKAVES